ncbi:MAG: cytochrome-c peroxidase [Chloroflexi bacterium]|nr:cytochrome-c peroxidase [Chloroflexota bacterium]
MRKVHGVLICIVAIFMVVGCTGRESLDEQLQSAIDMHQITVVDPGPTPEEAKVVLGQMLFFDKEISGNRDIACATCHHPTEGSGDSIAVSIGTGGAGLGPERQIGYGRSFIPRNAPEVFNRGSEDWHSMFWDSRVFEKNGQFFSPAGDKLPDGFDNVLAVQAMFPVTSGDEMRGAEGDMDVNGEVNELAMIDADDLTAIWEGLMVRLLENPEYVALFEAAYPGTPVEELGFQHAANAIAAFEIDAYTLIDSPWQNYLQGDTTALTDEEKEGAILFYGDAGCASCHSGSLMTNQQHATIAAPQVGPGKGDESPLDLGRFRESQDDSDMYAFRVPSLHNVAVSRPWMHDGAFNTLEAVVMHHLDPAHSLNNYDPAAHLPPELQDTFQNDPALLADMLDYVDPMLAPSRDLTQAEIQSLLAFLNALTDPAVSEMDQYVPASVPSGLPVEDLPAQGAN